MKIKLLSLLIISSLTLHSSQTFAKYIPSNDEFFSDPQTKISFTIFEQDNQVKASVIGSQEIGENQEQRSKIVDAFTTLLEYNHDDEELFSREVLMGNVFVGGNLHPFSEPYTAQQKIPYTLQDKQHQEDQAPLGQWYTVYQILHYLRPDQTLYDVKIPLYQQMKTEEMRSTGQRKKYCVKEETKISKLKKKTDHTIQEFTLDDIYSLLWQRKLDGTEEVKISETKTRTEEKFYQTYKSSSECAQKK